jgi:PEP-CTERM motif
MKTWTLQVGLAVGTFFLASSSYALPITVSNFSFETLPAGGLPTACGTGCSFSAGTGIPGWVATGASTGEFQPGPPATTTFFNSVPDGSTIGYTSSGTISQTVAPTVQLGVVYTLMVDLGLRKDGPDPGTEALVINGNTYFATGVAPVQGGWSTFTVTYTGLSADVGKSITIQLASSGAGQGDWDNVRLSDSTTSAVPEPTTGMLLGLAGLAWAGISSRRKHA